MPSFRELMFVLFVLLLPRMAHAYVFPVEKDVRWSGRHIGDHTRFFVDERELSLADLQAIFQSQAVPTSRQSIINVGLTRKKVYGAFELRSDGDREVLLEIDHPFLNRFHLMYEEGGVWREKRTGLLYNFSDRDVKTRSYVVLLRLRVGINTFYFQASGDNAIQVPLRIWSPDEFHAFDKGRRTLLDWVFGGLLILLIYNLFIYANLRDKVYLYYTIYVAALLSYELVSLGSLPELCFDLFELNVKANYLSPIFACVIITGASFFAPAFLEIPPRTRLGRAFSTLPWFCLSTMFAAPFFPFFASVFCFVIIASMTVPSVWAIYVKYVETSHKNYLKIFIVAWAVYVLGATLHSSNLLGLIASTAVSKYGHLTAGTLEICLLSLALVNKIKDYQKTIHEEQRAKAHSYDQLTKVFYPHQLSMIKSGHQLEDTMPTSSGEACVICFDIVGSSKLQHEKTKEFMRNVFRRCYEVMMEGYDGTRLEGNAYRIKEMGDGFLCSVGYPFKSRTGHMANDAFELALKFHAIFMDEVSKLGYREPIRCSIGLALDHIAGFYPESGTKEYDLFGKAIILATRYEGMRKSILKDEESSSLMIVQERVHLSLHDKFAGRFSAFDLATAQLSVRDDPTAERLYYLRLSNRSETLRGAA